MDSEDGSNFGRKMVSLRERKERDLVRKRNDFIVGKVRIDSCGNNENFLEKRRYNTDKIPLDTIADILDVAARKRFERTYGALENGYAIGYLSMENEKARVGLIYLYIVKEMVIDMLMP